MYFVAWLAFQVFGKSDVQEWAKINNDEDLALKVGQSGKGAYGIK